MDGLQYIKDRLIADPIAAYKIWMAYIKDRLIAVPITADKIWMAFIKDRLIGDPITADKIWMAYIKDRLIADPIAADKIRMSYPSGGEPMARVPEVALRALPVDTHALEKVKYALDFSCHSSAQGAL